MEVVVNGWYVAKSKARKEDWLQRGLRQQGVEVYVPRIVVRKRGRQTTEPLFPTYLFCNFDPEDPERSSIYRTPGLKFFLGADRRPSQVPSEIVSYLKQRVSNWNGGGFGPENLKIGDEVRITNGPFASLKGIFQNYIPSRRRCQILLHIVGGLTTVELSENDLAVSMTTF